MSVYKYEILNPVTDNKKPFLNRKGFFVFYVGKRYSYYIEAAINNPRDNVREYRLLLSDVKFDSHCRRCSTDIYGRCMIKVRGEFKSYIEDEINFRGNVDVNYIETDEAYDVYEVR